MLAAFSCILQVILEIKTTQFKFQYKNIKIIKIGTGEN